MNVKVGSCEGASLSQTSSGPNEEKGPTNSLPTWSASGTSNNHADIGACCATNKRLLGLKRSGGGESTDLSKSTGLAEETKATGRQRKRKVDSGCQKSPKSIKNNCFALIQKTDSETTPGTSGIQRPKAKRTKVMGNSSMKTRLKETHGSDNDFITSLLQDEVKKLQREKEDKEKEFNIKKLEIEKQYQEAQRQVEQRLLQQREKELDELVETLQCSICRELFIKATALTCAHTFCQLCIKQWLRLKRECPVCRMSAIDTMRSTALDQCVDTVVSQLSESQQTQRTEILLLRKDEEERLNVLAAGPSSPSAARTTPWRRRRSRPREDTSQGRRPTRLGFLYRLGRNRINNFFSTARGSAGTSAEFNDASTTTSDSLEQNHAAVIPDSFQERSSNQWSASSDPARAGNTGYVNSSSGVWRRRARSLIGQNERPSEVNGNNLPLSSLPRGETGQGGSDSDRPHPLHDLHVSNQSSHLQLGTGPRRATNAPILQGQGCVSRTVQGTPGHPVASPNADQTSIGLTLTSLAHQQFNTPLTRPQVRPLNIKPHGTLKSPTISNTDQNSIVSHNAQTRGQAAMLTQQNGRLPIAPVGPMLTNNNQAESSVVPVPPGSSSQWPIDRLNCFHSPEDAAFIQQNWTNPQSFSDRDGSSNGSEGSTRLLQMFHTYWNQSSQ